MLNKTNLKLALRFVRSRRKGALTRFISFASTCGIAIGVFAAIVGFSAMNGFEYELENRVLSVIPSAQLNSRNFYFKDVESIENTLKEHPDIVSTSPVIEQSSIVSANRAFTPILINGIYSNQESSVIGIQNFINVDLRCLSLDAVDDDNLNCKLDHIKSLAAQNAKPKNTVDKQSTDYQEDLKDIEKLEDLEVVSKAIQDKQQLLPRIILGSGIAKRLNVHVGDLIDVYTFEVTPDDDESGRSISLANVGSLKTPQKTKALVIGFIHIGGQLDSSLALMDFEVLKDMSNLQGPNSIHIKTNNLIKTKEIVMQASVGKIKESAYLVTWMNTQGKLYHDIQMVRQIMFIAMFLVLAVACFNIISNLMMLVGEKRREIAILLTMGMTPQQVIKTFSLMGVISGFYGLLIGVISGLVVSLIVTPITSSFRDIFGFDLLNEDIYFINFIPCRLEIFDVLLVITIAVVMCFVASIYPAIRASQIKPASELNL